MCKWKTKLSHFPWALWIDRDCSSGNAGQEARGGSWAFVLNATSPPETGVSAQSWTVNLLSTLTPRSLVFLLFLRPRIKPKHHYPSVFAAKRWALARPKTFHSPTWCLFLNSWSCSAATRQSRPIEPRLALMPHPTQCEMRGSGSEWMGKLERCMGTASARAVGGSPLTMLWLLLCTINRC